MAVFERLDVCEIMASESTALVNKNGVQIVNVVTFNCHTILDELVVFHVFQVSYLFKS